MNVRLAFYIPPYILRSCEKPFSFEARRRRLGALEFYLKTTKVAHRRAVADRVSRYEQMRNGIARPPARPRHHHAGSAGLERSKVFLCRRAGAKSCSTYILVLRPFRIRRIEIGPISMSIDRPPYELTQESRKRFRRLPFKTLAGCIASMAKARLKDRVWRRKGLMV